MQGPDGEGSRGVGKRGTAGLGATRREVEAAMRRVQRELFLPGGIKRHAHLDSALPIGYGQTNSQPATVANMMELLDVPPGARVLDVGSGSGWSTAILADLVGPDGEVFGVELVPELVERGRAAVESFDTPWASIRQAEPGVLGLPDLAPFDRILVSAMADAIPGELVDQLAPGGVMVVPADGTMYRVEKADGDGEGGDDISISAHGHYLFVPLL